MMLFIGIAVKSPDYFRIAFGISFPIILTVWIIFLVIRYLPVNGLIKTAITIFIVSLYGYLSDIITAHLVIGAVEYDSVQISQSPSALYIIIGASIAAIFLIIGIIVTIAGGKKNEEA